MALSGRSTDTTELNEQPLALLRNIIKSPNTEPTAENIETFRINARILLRTSSDPQSDSFQDTLDFFKTTYQEEKNRRPPNRRVFALLSARYIHILYTQTLPKDGGLPLTDPLMIPCIEWAQVLTNFPKLNNPLLCESKIKADTTHWLAGIYERRGLSQAEKEGIKPNSRNPLIRKGLFYLNKTIEILCASPTLNYSETSKIFNESIKSFLNYLPENATLQDEITKRTIILLEKIIAFHQHIPKNTNPDVEANYITTLKALAKVYAILPIAKGKTPDYERAIYIFLTINQPLSEFIVKTGWTPAILNTAIENLSKNINAVHAKLLILITHYLQKNLDIENREKNTVFKALKNTLLLNDSTDATAEQLLANKLHAIETFKSQLENPDTLAILEKHRIDKLPRDIYNAVSAFTIFPAAYRAISNYVRYRTFRFWKPESEKLAICAQAEIHHQLDNIAPFKKG